MGGKFRILLWEEFRTNGRSAGWVLLGLLLAALSLELLDAFGVELQDTKPIFPFFVLIIFLPIVCVRRHRPEQATFFLDELPTRILVLPIETWRLVGYLLLIRGGLVFTATALFLSSLWLVSGRNDVWFGLLPPLGFYLVIQCVIWIGRTLPLLSLATPLVWAAILALLMSNRINPLSWPTAGVLFVFCCVSSYAHSVMGMRRSRCGEYWDLEIPFPETMALPIKSGVRGFTSPRWAFLWRYQQEKSTRNFLGMATGFFLLWVGLGYAAHLSSDIEWDWVLFTIGGSVRTGISWSLFPVEWAPWPAVILAALAWGYFHGGAVRDKGERPCLAEYLRPMSSADTAVTRLWGHGIVLGQTWIAALLICNGVFFLGYDFFAWRIYSASLAAGESTVREILESRLIIPLAVLFVAWVLMVLRTRVAAWLLGSLVLLWTAGSAFYILYEVIGMWIFAVVADLLVFVFGGIGLWKKHNGRPVPWRGLYWAIPCVLAMVLCSSGTSHVAQRWWLSVALMIVVPAAALVWAWHRGLAPRHHFMGCVLLWMLVTLFCYPFGQQELSGLDRVALLMAMAVAALIILPYPALLIDIHRHRHNDDTTIAPEEQVHSTPWRLGVVARAGILCMLAAILCFGAWLRWPAKPAYIEALRAQGQPATLTDLLQFYGALPQQENSAFQYLKVMKQHKESKADWDAWVLERRAAVESAEDKVALEQGQYLANRDPRKLIWTKAWEVARFRYEMADRPVANAFEGIAKAGYRHGRNPVVGINSRVAYLPHPGELRGLIQSQSFAVWMAAAEGRGEDVLSRLQALGALAEALSDEPSLMRRNYLDKTMVQSLERAFTRTTFTAEQLVGIQHAFGALLVPVTEYRTIGKNRLYRTMLFIDGYGGRIIPEMLHGLRSYSRAVTLRRLAEVDLYVPIERNGNTPFLSETKAEQRGHRFPLLPLAGILDMEWSCRTGIELAAVACAVERYRVVRGALPENLEALVPDFIGDVPADPFREEAPISYVPHEDGSFVLYSWGSNRTDEQGVAPAARPWDSYKDVTFTVAPLALRERSQFTDTPPEIRIMEERSRASGLGLLDSRRNARPRRR